MLAVFTVGPRDQYFIGMIGQILNVISLKEAPFKFILNSLFD